jgi:hypothetical protein
MRQRLLPDGKIPHHQGHRRHGTTTPKSMPHISTSHPSERNLLSQWQNASNQLCIGQQAPHTTKHTYMATTIPPTPHCLVCLEETTSPTLLHHSSPPTTTRNSQTVDPNGPAIPTMGRLYRHNCTRVISSRLAHQHHTPTPPAYRHGTLQPTRGPCHPHPKYSHSCSDPCHSTRLKSHGLSQAVPTHSYPGVTPHSIRPPTQPPTKRATISWQPHPDANMPTNLHGQAKCTAAQMARSAKTPQATHGSCKAAGQGISWPAMHAPIQ